MKYLFLLLVGALLASCAPATASASPQLVNVFVTSAAYPRVSVLYSCASPAAVISLSDPASADLTIRLGEPSPLTAPAYQIGTEDILVVNHPQAGVGSLSLEQVQQLFSGRVTNWKEVGGNDLPVQVWTYSSDEDIQQAFDRLVMNGQPVTSLARLAVSSQAMSDAVGNTPGAVGLLPRRWKAGNTREAFKAVTVPVLAVVRGEPQGAVKALIACLQASK
jgi:phosphate transport system substrate-binding protein